MEKKILYVGLDVDDKAFHGCALIGDTGEVIEFKSRPHIDGLTKKLVDLHQKFSKYQIHVCYEATYIGFTLQRGLVSEGFHCDVIAPSSIPRPPGDQVKTDRLDAGKLAQYYSAGILSVVTPPDPDIEQDRDLMRSRQFVVKQISELRSHILSNLRRCGKNYKAETGNLSHWGKHHMCWIQRVIDEGTGSTKANLNLLFTQLKLLDHTLSEYNKEVEELAKSEKYARQVQALTCYRGVKNIFALVMITEIGNIKRFTHPRKLASWSGLDIREYSSGGVHRRHGITNHGNRYLRTALVEANQRAGIRIGLPCKDVRLRRQKLPVELVAIAERCDKRLAKKSGRMRHAGKHTNKIKVACAREMVGFIWESLNKIAA